MQLKVSVARVKTDSPPAVHLGDIVDIRGNNDCFSLNVPSPELRGELEHFRSSAV